METVLLLVTIGSLILALVMSAATWRLAREGRARSAARVAALAAAASEAVPVTGQSAAVVPAAPAGDKAPRAPWAAARVSAFSPARPIATAASAAAADLSLNAPAIEDEPLPLGVINPIRTASVGSTFLGSSNERAQSGGRQRSIPNP